MIKTIAIEPLEKIIQQVLNGEIQYDVFLKEWKNNEFLGEVCEEIFQDLEFAIQHTPGFVFQNKIDIKKWEMQEEFFVVLIDFKLIEFTSDSEKWKRCKKIIVDSSKNCSTKEELLRIIENQLRLTK